MENNQETQTMSQEPIMNKKMTTCKTCGSAMAKSAKKCPSCGAKNKIRKLKKLIISVAIIFVFFIVIKIMQQPTKATVGETYTFNDLEFTIEYIGFRHNLKTGNSMVDNKSCIAIYGTIENKGKSNRTIYADDFEIDYDDGYKIDEGHLYLESSSYEDVSGEEHKEFRYYEGGVILDPLETGITDFVVLIPVPENVLKNGDKKIALNVYKHKYKFDSVSELENSMEDIKDRLSDIFE